MAQTYSAGPYITWAHPSGSYAIEYSQPLIFELEYLASEGYRRIPHGGIEIGGLLFGRVEGTTIRVQEFRLIECEHAFGPSFQLSERDLTKLREQMKAEKEPELAELQIVGWFIAHTRSELLINDAEAKIFEELFPERTSVTLLIKPEKFKATRFAFLRRDKDGVLERDGTTNTFILPLQGRTDGGSAEELKPADRGADRGSGTPDRLPSPVPEPTRRDGGSEEPVLRADPGPEPVRAAQRNLVQRELSELDRIAGPLANDDEALPSPPPTRAIYPSSAAYPVPAPAYPSQIDELPTPRRRRPRPRDWELEDAAPAPARAESRPSSVQFAMILMIAAALGCAVGYWAYLQLPSPVILLSVKDQPNALLVTWAPEQTREAVYAAIRVDDGPPVLLSADDRANGTTNVPAINESVKIELIIRHWLRDSRGIIRYLRPAVPASRPQTSTGLRGRTRP